MVTPVIAVMNYLANDGPIFSPVLAAVLVVVPVGMMIFIAQVIIVSFELMAKRILKIPYWSLGWQAGANWGARRKWDGQILSHRGGRFRLTKGISVV